MAWLWRGIIVLLGLLSQTVYVRSCDADCKDDLIQRIDNLLDKKMDLMKLEMETKFQNVLETQHNLQMDQISNTITTTQAALTRDLQSVNTRVQKYEQNFEELKTLNFFIISQITDHLAQDRATQNPSASPSVNDLNDPINDLKTLTRESNVILNDIRESIEDCKNASNTTAQQLNDIRESIEDCKDASNTTTQQLNDIRESIEDCKGTSNTTTQQLNYFWENMEEMNQNRMEVDNDTMNSMQMLSNEVENVIQETTSLEPRLLDLERNITSQLIDLEDKMKESDNMLLKSITCPSGFFKMSSQCFKMFRDRERSWSEAKTKCEEEGYMLAQPDESVAVSLRKKLYEDFGDRSFAWLGAQGDGSKFVYAHGGLALDNASPLWWPDQPGSYVGADKCLFLLVDGSYFRDHPARPYFSNGCSASWYALCEVK
ncbi:unnamed protein product [Meganyctiphanes norvegica]|uniref:C-type lectin domain-containing protein n=1 Tax=Meganyctiphanes norvegica TaxID=48144 RepID=A0AAV2PYY0_MEGNR